MPVKHFKLTWCAMALFSVQSLAGASPAYDLRVSTIPAEMKRNAHVVVRFSDEEFEYKSEQAGVYRHETAITVLNINGEDMAGFHYPGDKFKQLSSFTATLFDAEGKQIRKYKLSDVEAIQWSPNLADYGKHYLFDFDAPQVPFTVLYSYEVSFRNAMLSFPTFMPQDSHSQSVERASYRLILPPEVKYIARGINMDEAPKQSMLKNQVCYEWELGSLSAIEREPYMPEMDSYFKILRIRPVKFVYDNVPGAFDDWAGMGRWEYSLIEGRDVLSDATKAKIDALTANCSTDREKVKVLYDYLGATTRYVSIQLGIGGFQPIAAAEVARTGFGDCKGLSNYLRAMLGYAGIESNYTVIQFDRNGGKNLMTDYPNFNQMNHVILQVPLSGDTLWLECTDPRVPFGYVHPGIAGHEALVVSRQDGAIIHLPEYPDSLHVERNIVSVELTGDGSAKISAQREYRVNLYDRFSQLMTEKPSARTDHLRRSIGLPNVEMGPVSVSEDKSALPSMTFDYRWSTTNFGNKTGSRLFIPVNIFVPPSVDKPKTKRVYPFRRSYGYIQTDSIRIAIPEGYVIESLPAPLSAESPFGCFESVVAFDGSTITISQQMLFRSGEWEASQYDDFVAFVNKATGMYKAQITLKKE